MAENIVDACCMINLYAAGEITSFLSVLADSFYVPSIVVDESFYVIKPDRDDPDRDDPEKMITEEIDLTAALQAGAIRKCDPEGEEENALLVQFASEVDDGEAVCLAIAKGRGWSVATDDRKAQRLAGESGISVVTTPELIKGWADASQATDEESSAVVQRVRYCARFIPRRGSILYDWWMVRLQSAGG